MRCGLDEAIVARVGLNYGEFIARHHTLLQAESVTTERARRLIEWQLDKTRLYLYCAPNLNHCPGRVRPGLLRGEVRIS